MTPLAALILAIVFGPSALLLAYALAVLARHARRRHAGRQLPTLSHRQCADNLRPYGADITVAPARAPRNGNTHDPAHK